MAEERAAKKPPVRVLEVPGVIDTASVQVRSSLNTGDMIVRHTAVVRGGHSRRDLDVALHQARRELAHVPEEIRHVEIVVDRHAAAQMQAAAEKRARRARRGW